MNSFTSRHLIDPEDRRRVIVEFRHMAFQIAYSTMFASIESKTVRFGYALAYSVQPVKNEAMITAWWEFTHGLTMETALKRRHDVPPILKPLIDAWRAAVAQREAMEAESMTFDGRGKVHRGKQIVIESEDEP